MNCSMISLGNFFVTKNLFNFCLGLLPPLMHTYEINEKRSGTEWFETIQKTHRLDHLRHYFWVSNTLSKDMIAKILKRIEVGVAICKAVLRSILNIFKAVLKSLT